MTGQPEWVELWDGRSWPGTVRDGLPEFRRRQAPAGLATRRQLRSKGLCPGGQEPFARLTWKRSDRFAWLYVEANAKPKRTATDAQLAAVEKALAARKVCAECGPVDHFVRTTDHLCGDCHSDGVEPRPDQGATWRTLHNWMDDADDSADDDPAVEASAAVDQAAQAVEQAAGERRARDDAAERDGQFARWHTDDTDRAPARGHHDEFPAGDESWPGVEVGAA
ncbi:RRQRL motif-containing zinc-binding protein [Kribbella lupini]|uniref:HNH endonuclease n=1 Tax=Kribbella lupini TaxID=291602 RepID=A0ABP4LT58_9ACTN